MDQETRLALLEQSYKQVETRLDKVEVKIDDLHAQMVAGQNNLTKVIVGAAGTVVASILSVVVVLLMS
jgi:tetrahydromethanopterin S-methyltransferase subunit G